MDALTCPSCFIKIEKAVRKQEGAQNVEVRFNAGKVKIEFLPAVVQAEVLSRVVEHLGYQVLDKQVRKVGDA
ncbi:heavy-metal-associated domain-containing protein [Weissella kandleri]|uniref:heavy-metal-associated domain-containing protein n=1 Tax=Weissella kandleri TaxID=1616 RepID=UPI00387EC009